MLNNTFINKKIFILLIKIMLIIISYSSPEPDISSKHVPLSQSSSSSDAHITVQTPNASKFFDDILAIPINTLGAVNKFLENNVAGRKRFQVTQEGSVAEPARVRLGPHARRRANKHVVILHETPEEHKE